MVCGLLSSIPGATAKKKKAPIQIAFNICMEIAHGDALA
jgi:hypothetical protein